MQGAAANLAATLIPSLVGGLLLVLLPVALAMLALRRRAKRRAEEAALNGDSAKGEDGSVGSAALTKALPQEPLPVLLGLWGAPGKPDLAADAELGGAGHAAPLSRQVSATRDGSAKRSDPSSHALSFAEASSQVGTLLVCSLTE